MTGSASFSGTHPSLSLPSLSRGERAFERESERVIDDDERHAQCDSFASVGSEPPLFFLQ